MCSYCCVWLSEFSRAGLTKYLTKRQESINRHIMSLDYLKIFFIHMNLMVCDFCACVWVLNTRIVGIFHVVGISSQVILIV